MSDPEVSIVIVSWNVRDLLIDCLQSIERFVRTPHEVVVVDNHSSDETVEMVRQKFPNVTVIANATNAGFARANNQGWERTSGKYVFFLNPDTEFINDPFPALVQYASTHPKAGCIGPELLNSDRTHQPSVRRFPRLADQFFVLLKLRMLYKIIPPLKRYMADVPMTDKEPKIVEQLMGAALFIPRGVLLAGNTFDEGYWIWFEEVDLCSRIQQSGKDIVYLPTAQIIHHGGKSFIQHVSLAKHVWLLKSLLRYAKKYWQPWEVAVLYVLMPISYVLTIIQSLFKPR